jgi:hypothetical protein
VVLRQVSACFSFAGCADQGTRSFDKDGFSVWRVDFKYNEELTQVFMSSNQIGGFFNRLEASRKYLFGSVGVLGEANASIISGVLILRGQDSKLAVDCAPDYESYDYTKLDVFGNEQDKVFFEGALAWDLEVDGKKWADGKNVSVFFLSIVLIADALHCSSSKNHLITKSVGLWGSCGCNFVYHRVFYM